MLLLAIPAPQCIPDNFLILTNSSTQGEHTLPGRASIRVDERAIYEADTTLEKSKDMVTVSFERVYNSGNSNLMNDAIRGNVIRFQLEIQGGGSAVYKKYSLAGFTAATKRAVDLCRAATPKSDEEYFSPGSSRQSQPAKPKQKTDEEYF